MAGGLAYALTLVPGGRRLVADAMRWEELHLRARALGLTDDERHDLEAWAKETADVLAAESVYEVWAAPTPAAIFDSALVEYTRSGNLPTEPMGSTAEHLGRLRAALAEVARLSLLGR